MTQNFPNYIKSEGEQKFNILKELKELKFKKKIILLKNNNIIQCYSIFSPSTLYFLTNIPIINESVSISILVSTEKNH